MHLKTMSYQVFITSVEITHPHSLIYYIDVMWEDGFIYKSKINIPEEYLTLKGRIVWDTVNWILTRREANENIVGKNT